MNTYNNSGRSGKNIRLDFKNAFPYVGEKEIHASIAENTELFQKINQGQKAATDVLGWFEVTSLMDEPLLAKIETKACQIRENGDIFILIGIGGSNQGARAAIKAMHPEYSGIPDKPQIIYAGNNLAVDYLKSVLKQSQGKSVYVDVIAKNFATLEPGIVFRMVRRFMEDTYGEKEAATRICATGSLNGSSLEKLGQAKGYSLFPFPLEVGGRYSVLTAVGLLPMAVAGLDIRQMLAGARDMKQLLKSAKCEENPAVLYAVIRNLLLKKGYGVEILSHFEPRLEYFAKWWIQLFGESEGKNGTGIYPTTCSYTEDLHSLGQYIQQGKRFLLESFLTIEEPQEALPIPEAKKDQDGFDYLELKEFAVLNEAAFQATVKAHHDGGVPCLNINVPGISEYYLGQLFYFFEYACFVSGNLLGVDPFDQPGVENYKTKMFEILGRP
ncbi:MAG TPA: glucose-6-phosphate isomerase [Firmicutes bacterium]|jgi:glucose-6-phosphate isomerase|nr:glucose-6-phosphate isomerase [Bacillota bacterium]